MPEPLRGLVAIAEFGSRLEADIVVERLRDAEINATVSSDPAMASAAPYLASDRTFEVIVREGDADRARNVVRGDLDDLPSEFTDPWERPRRPAARARARSCLITVIVVLFVIVMITLVVGASRR